MVHILSCPLFAETVRVSSTYWLNNPSLLQSYLEEHDINTIYIAPAKYLDSLESKLTMLKNIARVEIYPFGGGFKLRSMILFGLESEEDYKFFTKITEWKITKGGDIILE